MAGFARAKQVTDPLDDKVKARIVGRDRRQLSYVSSGSEHGGDEDESPCLSDLVHGFLENDAGAHSPERTSDSERDPPLFDSTAAMEGLLNAMTIDNADSFRNLLFSHVSEAVDMFSSLRSNKLICRRKVMGFLRDSGYNAAICKTKWQSAGGITDGNYEFIDVVRSEASAWHQQQRYFIDVDFAAEFEIARPTDRYEKLLQSLPKVFVGRGEELKQIVRLMCDEAKRSLRTRGLHLPPWRKNRYMQSKWFGPYRRTVNQVPANSLAFSPSSVQKFNVKCRAVGFDAVPNANGRFLFPAATRTR